MAQASNSKPRPWRGSWHLGIAMAVRMVGVAMAMAMDPASVPHPKTLSHCCLDKNAHKKATSVAVDSFSAVQNQNLLKPFVHAWTEYMDAGPSVVSPV